MTRVKRLNYIALLVAQGVIIGLIENSIPFPFAVAPGAKLGLANLITVIAIYTLPIPESFLLVWLRLILTTLLGGTISTFLYSMTGSLLSYLVMLGLKQLGPKRISVIGVSTAGAFFHNVGQLLVASWIARSFTVMLYLPVLSIVGILAGIAIGIAANYLLKHVKVLKQFEQNYQQTIKHRRSNKANGNSSNLE